MDTSAGEAPDPLVGRLLDDRYALDAFVAQGGMATVYRATDTRLERTVAVKVMARRYADDPEFVARFTREAKASARLSNSHVVAVYDYGTDRGSGLAYLVMELVPGRNLRQVLLDHGALPAARVVAIMDPVLQALAAAHAAGIVHRDVKPENVLLGDDGQVKVADFGLARAVETNNLTATTGLLLGTVAYLAPEQVVSGSADARTDVYAAGILLWELLTGVPPYASDSPLSVAYKHVNEDVPAPSQVVGGVPTALDDLVVRATRREPSARPHDGGAFLADLRRVAAGSSISATPQPRYDTQVLPTGRPASGSTPVATDPRTPRRRAGWIAALLVLVLAAGLAGGSYLLGTERFTRTPGVLRLTLATATAKLTGAGLTVAGTTMVFDESLAAGEVRSQNPVPGAKIPKHGTVHLVVSKGPDRRTVPPVVGRPIAEATRALQAQGLNVPAPSKVFSTAVPSGVVIRVTPPAGTRLQPGAPVSLVVSKGVELLPVPNTVGRTQRDAGKLLEDLGFRTTVTEEFSDTVAVGTVLTQAPADGRAARGSTVALTVSKGPDTVILPDVRDMAVQKAVDALKAMGLKVTTHTLPGGSGNVLAQSPGGGTKVRRGSTVTLYVF